MVVMLTSMSDALHTPALDVLRAANVPHRVFTFDSSSSEYGKEAAEIMCERLGIDASQIFKTLVIEVADPTVPEGRYLAIAILPVTCRLNLAKAAEAFGGAAARMAPINKAEKMTGYTAGGISPFGQRCTLPTRVDPSALSWEKIYVSGGKRGCDVEILPADLIELTSAEIAEIREA